jgi:hypothetical protein
MEYINNLLKQIIALQEENEQLKLRLSGVGSSLSDNKTTIVEWIKLNNCSHRLKSSLKTYNNHIIEKQGHVFIEDITPNDASRFINLSKKAWEEFLELRGY